jgi:spermidine synthase
MVNGDMLPFNLFIVGFAGTSFQFLLAREIMNISGGHELVTGIFLGSWLIASAAGAALAGKSSLNEIKKINIIFSASPVASLALLLVLSRLFLETGETPSLLTSILFTLLVLFPFCLVSGFTFVKLIQAAREANSSDPGKSFSMETVGGIVAGILLTVFTSGSFGTYKLFLIILLMLNAYTLITFVAEKTAIKMIFRVCILIVVSAVIFIDPDILFRKILLPGVTVTASADTPYGNITTGSYSGEESVYYNHKLLSYAHDVVEREEDVHYALLQRPEPEEILVISGSPRVHLQEILKYNVTSVTFIERDPFLAGKARDFISDKPVHVRAENMDAFRFIREAKDEKYDAVIILLPPPSTLSLNRFYTTEFFSSVRKKLVAGGIFACSPCLSENYYNDETVNLVSSVYNSLASVFRHVKPVAGQKLYLLASDESLSVEFCSLSVQRRVSNTYVSNDYLTDDLLENKSERIVNLIEKNARPNNSSFPIACFHFQSYYFSRDIDEKIPAILMLAVVFAVPVFFTRRSLLMMYCSASGLAGFEIILLLTLQVTAGNMYQMTGLVLASVMTGLAIGAGSRVKFHHAITLKVKVILVAAFYILTGLFYNDILSVRSMFVSVIIVVVLSLFPSFATGHFFRILTSGDDDGKITAPVYSADLAGSAMGFILITGILIPLSGMRTSIFILAAIILAGILFGSTSNKN